MVMALLLSSFVHDTEWLSNALSDGLVQVTNQLVIVKRTAAVGDNRCSDAAQLGCKWEWHGLEAVHNCAKGAGCCSVHEAPRQFVHDLPAARIHHWSSAAEYDACPNV